MPKMKTKSGAKKRFRLTANGKVRGSAAFLSHNLRRRSQKMKRQARGTISCVMRMRASLNVSFHTLNGGW